MKDETLVCRCCEVTLGEIREAVRNGAHDVNSVKRWTRAGMGLCQGRTCWVVIARIISEELGKPISEVQPGTARPPVCPVPIRIVGDISQPESQQDVSKEKAESLPSVKRRKI